MFYTWVYLIFTVVLFFHKFISTNILFPILLETQSKADLFHLILLNFSKFQNNPSKYEVSLIVSDF